ncbi:hypothetical protein Q7I15_02935 [Aeromonas veronii]|uniref:hypothetical protein n=1 Tax=Aeromonas TaxID=642 RepID=UPI0013021AFB|nr:hypothetical protein [Aeromonas veronii]KAE9625765.1 hypothetical protein GO627_06425 [Aeromonas veronii]
MHYNHPNSSLQHDRLLSIENRCKIILDRQWTQYEVDAWLALLTPVERLYANELLQKKHPQTGPNQEYERNALTNWIEKPAMFPADLSDAELKRAIWKKSDEDKW